MKNISIWNDIKRKEYPTLDNDKNVDVLIIGGGITGASAMYHLKDTNLKIMLVEQNKIASAVTSNSTGKLTFLQNDLIDKIRKTFNDEKAIKYINSQINAINIIKDVIKNEDIDCDLEKTDSYIFTNNKKEIKKLKELEHFLNKYNMNTIKDDINYVESKYSFKVENTYMFNPVKFVTNLLNKIDLPIYENTSIKKIKKENDYYLCYTNKNTIKASYVIIASHYPYFILPFIFPIKSSLEKSYLSATKFKTKPFSLISYSYPFISARTYKNNIIYLSNSHSINNDVDDKKNFNELLKKLKDLNLNPDYIWSNSDIMTNDNLPYIGKLKDNILIGTGYNTWGLTNGFLAGKILSDIIQNKENEYIELFNPKRLNLSTIVKSIVNTGKSLKGYYSGCMYSKEKKICPHAKCGLIFNETEQTWDCPCHGSRFDKTGKCINGPSNKDIII